MIRQRLGASYKRQTGTALFVSLVILVVITLIGTASMRTSTMEMKMANSQRDRDITFSAAEAALIAAEQWLELHPPENAELIDTCGTGTTCFENTCTGGLCFDGEYTTSDEEIECIVGDSSGTNQRIDFWMDANLNVWQTAGKHQTVSIEGLDNDAKFIIEFLCYVAPTSAEPFNATTARNGGEPLYRITAVAEGNGDKATVMLQSTYLLVES